MLVYKFFTHVRSEAWLDLDDSDILSGVIIPEERYLDLVVKDIYDREWHAERLRPEQIVFATAGDVIGGSLDLLAHEENLPVDRSGAGCVWWTTEAVKVPANQSTVTTKSIAAGKRKPGRRSRDVWSFRCLGQNILMGPDQGGMRIDVWDTTNVPSPVLLRRIPEALHFVLGRPIRWVIHQERTGSIRKTSLRSLEPAFIGADFRPPIKRPLLVENGKTTSKYHKQLFEKYLRHTIGSPERDHPLWGFINTISEVKSISYIDAHALVLGVTLESVLEREFPELGTRPSSVDAAIRDAQGYIRAWEGDPGVWNRLDSFAGRLPRLGPVDRLRALAAKGLIDRKLIKSWEKLRNINAHEFQSGKLNAEQLSDLLQRCTVLFYQIVFARIKYRGVYTDYATPGWPERVYPDHLRDD